MKVDREAVVAALRNHPRGMRFGALCDLIGARSERKVAGLARLLKLLEKAGVAVQHGGVYRIAEETRKRAVDASAAGTPAAEDFQRVLEHNGLSPDFPADALKQADRLTVIRDKEIKRRPRVEGWVVTIDSEKAKDLDDAVSLEKTADGYELAVHIADVSAYVTPDSALDREAFNRGTSVYLIDRVVPMFPPQLSNDLCSLNAGEPKLAFSVFLRLDAEGRALSSRFVQTVITVSRRLSYKEVEAVLRGKDDPDRERIAALAALATLLRERRLAEGSLMFELPEVEIELDAAGEPAAFRVPERLESEMVVEECMLAANRAVAGYLGERGASLFRIHETPNEEKLDGFFEYASRVGLRVRRPSELTPLSMQRLLDTARSNPSAAILNTLLLRSMQKAVYSTDNPGHFGLAFPDYTHFTSPIRRYPDLIVHRLLSGALRGKRAYPIKKLHRIAEQSTAREQTAIEAERELIRIKGARFLGKRVGEVFDGRIGGATAWGLYITVLPFGIEGMLHVSRLRDDRYQLDPYGHALVGTGKKRRFQIGDALRVRVVSVNPEKGFVDLELE